MVMEGSSLSTEDRAILRSTMASGSSSCLPSSDASWFSRLLMYLSDARRAAGSFMGLPDRAIKSSTPSGAETVTWLGLGASAPAVSAITSRGATMPQSNRLLHQTDRTGPRHCAAVAGPWVLCRGARPRAGVASRLQPVQTGPPVLLRFRVELPPCHVGPVWRRRLGEIDAEVRTAYAPNVATASRWPVAAAGWSYRHASVTGSSSGASGPEAHPSFMEFYLNPTVETREVKIEGQRTGRCRQFPFRSGFATFVQAFKGRLDQRVRR